MLKNIDYIQLAGDSVDEIKTLESLERSPIDILLMGSGRNGERYTFAEKVSNQFPQTGIIMVEDELLEETMHNALFAGAKDVLIKPIDPEKLMNAIYRIQQLQERIVVSKTDSTTEKNPQK